MARQNKQTIDYFPHLCNHGKTMFILEGKYRNDGYSMWFKLLEMLGQTPGHYLDLNDEATSEFLQAKTGLSREVVFTILDLLARLGAIDKELWAEKIIWCENFIKGIEQVYRNRRVETPPRPSFYIEKPSADDIPTTKSTQTKLKETKLKETKLNTHRQSEFLKNAFETFWVTYPRKRAKGRAETAFKKAAPDELLLSVMIATLEQAKKSARWLEVGGKYIPNPATWINDKGWEDEYTEADYVQTGTRPKPGAPGYLYTEP